MRRGLVIDVSSVPPRPAGAGKYAIELVSNLGKLAGGFKLVTKSRDARFWQDSFDSVVVARSPSVTSLRIAWGESLLARRLASDDTSIYHGIHYAIPRSFSGKRVTTIHDLTMIEHPEWHQKTKVYYFARAIRYAVNHADAIIVPSDHTKARLESHFGKLDKVHVIHHGVDHGRFSHRANGISESEVTDRLRMTAEDRVVLHIGTIEPRKNIENLVRAFDLLASKDRRVRLVLLGQKGWKSQASLSRIDSSKFRERIELVGYVPENELAGLLGQASCVAYPSLAEGFGLPVLEAMAAGIPVVTSAGAVMEEVAGDCAWLCNPLDPTDIAAKIEEAISGTKVAQAKVAKGIGRSLEYDWFESAKKHLEVYESLGFTDES